MSPSINHPPAPSSLHCFCSGFVHCKLFLLLLSFCKAHVPFPHRNTCKCPFHCRKKVYEIPMCISGQAPADESEQPLNAISTTGACRSVLSGRRAAAFICSRAASTERMFNFALSSHGSIEQKLPIYTSCAQTVPCSSAHQNRHPTPIKFLSG